MACELRFIIPYNTTTFLLYDMEIRALGLRLPDFEARTEADGAETEAD